MRKHGNNKEWQPERAAANGILDRRVFLEGALVAAAAGAGVVEAHAEPLPVPNWMKQPGAAFSGYGQPSRFESKVVPLQPTPRPRASAPRAPRFSSSTGPSPRTACISTAAIPGRPTSTPTSIGC
jgi:hypothetical protein